MEKEKIVTLELQDEDISYQMYLPFKETDYIQKLVWNTKVPYEYEMLQAMLTRIPRDSLVLDIGMNIANHSLFFAANGLRVMGFEANPKMSEIAKKSIALNGFEERILVYEFGLSDKEEIMHYAREIPNNYGGMSLSKGKSTSGEGILCKTLDSLKIQEKISAIKIDVEGMESRVLKGARALIMKNRPIIYAEANYAQDFVKLERALETMDYVHWDTFGSSPTHLYLPLEQVSEKQILAKNAAKMTFQGLHYTGYRHRNWTTNILEKIDKEATKHTITLESISETIQNKQENTLHKILFSTAVNRTQSHLSYQLGQILIKDS
ncbi:FkbM family methyltransferase, partial [uncultured Helicobacter sp.]|uniref:FkbM family methyltransferase n=1 Tax=uncultured Helicobacter sp. TaxID=175537 RepID=UPI002604E549